MGRRLIIYAVLALMGMWGVAISQSASKPMERMTLRMGNNFLQLDVARDGTDIHKGLMHRQALAKNNGMLFVLPKATQYCFWMKNTLIPLSIAFINHRGYVMQINDMQPNSKQQYCTGESSRFAIEVNQGVFQVMAVKKGTRITGLPIF